MNTSPLKQNWHLIQTLSVALLDQHGLSVQQWTRELHCTAQKSSNYPSKQILYWLTKLWVLTFAPNVMSTSTALVQPFWAAMYMGVVLSYALQQYYKYPNNLQPYITSSINWYLKFNKYLDDMCISILCSNVKSCPSILKNTSLHIMETYNTLIRKLLITQYLLLN